MLAFLGAEGGCWHGAVAIPYLRRQSTVGSYVEARGDRRSLSTFLIAGLLVQNRIGGGVLAPRQREKGQRHGLDRRAEQIRGGVAPDVDTAPERWLDDHTPYSPLSSSHV